MAVSNDYINMRNIPVRSTVPYGTVPQKKNQDNSQTSFEGILNSKISEAKELKFSKHAELRLQSRNINLTQVQKDKLANALNKAQDKGVKDSLVIMDNLAFVINVKNRMVVTAVNNSELKDNVFTNIDGAVIV